MTEKVDVLIPPTFMKSGKKKTLEQAWNDADWIGTFNLWIVQDKPIPAIVYQQRSLDNSWAPGKLDVTAGGHYSAGEEIKDGMREVEEELGKNFKYSDLMYFGRKLHVSPDVKGRERHNVVDIFMIKDNSPLNSYELQESEVYSICACPIDDLIKVHTQKNYVFRVTALKSNGEKIEIKVNKDSFPFNWDNYHFKIVLLAQRFLKGEGNLLY